MAQPRLIVGSIVPLTSQVFAAPLPPLKQTQAWVDGDD